MENSLNRRLGADASVMVDCARVQSLIFDVWWTMLRCLQRIVIVACGIFQEEFFISRSRVPLPFVSQLVSGMTQGIYVCILLNFGHGDAEPSPEVAGFPDFLPLVRSLPHVVIVSSRPVQKQNPGSY